MDKANVLLVEDDLFLRDVYQEALASEPIVLEIAVDGQEAVEKIKSKNWDLVLLDDLLPKKSGVDVVKDLKKEKPDGKWNIVFFTNSHDSQDLNAIKELGYECVFKSDITPQDLISLVKFHLQKAST